MTSIGDYAFYWSGLVSITLPNSVKSIGKGAFELSSSLRSVTIGDSVTSIGDIAFDGCRSLRSVTIPKSVTNMGESAFSYCDDLTTFSILAPTPPVGGVKLLYRSGTSTIHVYEGLADVYKEVNGWNSYTFIDDIPIIRVASLTLDSTTYSCTIGQRITAQVVNYEPADATVKEVIWSSSDPSVLTIVPTTGVCVGLKDGIVTITATAKDSGHATATATVYVGNTVPEGIKNISVSPSDHTYYNLQGKCCTAPTRGINIVNGKKVLR